MKHLGDITKISGYSAPIVDCIIGGSPCQDISVAGKRAGLDGERSGLFMEQVRIAKEMRKRDEQNGRTGVDVRCRYLIWENVCGAFSSNKGEDFRIVLEELAKVNDKDAVIPMPDKGKWTTSGCIMGDGWSIAWRVLDAQFWGVPQRRRRIALVADFGGQFAPEILFVRKSVSGHSQPSKQKRKEPSSNASGSLGTDDSLGADQYNGVILGDTVSTLGVNCGMSHGRQCVLEPQEVVCFEPGIASREGGHIYENVSGTLRANAGDNQMATAYTLNGFDVGDVRTSEAVVYALDRASFNQGKNAQYDFEISDKGVNSPLVAKGPGAVCYSFNPTASRDAGEYILEGVANPLLNGTCPGHKSAVCYADIILDDQGGQQITVKDDGKAPTLRAETHGNLPCVLSVDQSGGKSSCNVTEGQAPTLTCTHEGEPAVAYCIGNGQVHDAQRPDKELCKTLNCMDDPMKIMTVHKTRYIVRRLTPLECERLQGYPDGWTDIGEWTDSNGKKRQTSDAQRYRALGNSIALPVWKWILKRLCACYERDATMASLFDGIGGFPLLWEQINGKGSCLWASEIEEFPIAVTKARIGE